MRIAIVAVEPGGRFVSAIGLVHIGLLSPCWRAVDAVVWW